MGWPCGSPCWGRHGAIAWRWGAVQVQVTQVMRQVPRLIEWGCHGGAPASLQALGGRKPWACQRPPGAVPALPPLNRHALRVAAQRDAFAPKFAGMKRPNQGVPSLHQAAHAQPHTDADLSLYLVHALAANPGGQVPARAGVPVCCPRQGSTTPQCPCQLGRQSPLVPCI